MSMRVLLSIKPIFVDKIFDGTKRFEFRRNIFKRTTSKIVVYASAPVSMVVGEFNIESIMCDELDKLWGQTEQFAGISKQYFYTYFQGKSQGYAIKIGKTKLYSIPQNIQLEYGIQPPQSFLYLLDDNAA